MNPTALFAAQYAEAIKLRREVDPIIGLYEKLGISYRANDFAAFNETVAQLRELATERTGEAASTLHFEKAYNGFEPFYRSSLAYVVIFVVACSSWLASAYSNSVGKSDCTAKMLRDAAFILTGIVLLSHTFGLFGRMYIEGRPPVTNLYSSALFIGWGAVLLCFATEKYLRLGVASAMGSFIGAGTLVVAYNLSLDSSLNPTGDTMEMMRAVLDSNFWVGHPCGHHNHRLFHYFFGRFLGNRLCFLSPQIRCFPPTRRQIEKNFGIDDFRNHLLFPFVQSGGNGPRRNLGGSIMGKVLGLGCQGERSSLIVIWNALLLHARFSGIARTRGLATIAIFGNIVTAWSWFGTNMLGVGLHSYGFMDKAFNSLMGFIISQLAIIALAYVPATVKMLIKLGSKPLSHSPSKETGA